MKTRSNTLLWMIHVLSWTYIFLSPLFFTPQNVPVDWRHIMSREFFSLALLLTFYLNYFLLVPKYFLYTRYRIFFLYNILLIIGLSGLYEVMHTFMVFKFMAQTLGVTSDSQALLPVTPASSLPGLQILLFLPQRHQSRFRAGLRSRREIERKVVCRGNGTQQSRTRTRGSRTPEPKKPNQPPLFAQYTQ